jgi:hypothetical protein
MKSENDTSCSFSWILDSVSGYRVADFHRAFDGMEKCIVVVKAENGRIATRMG